MKWNWNENFIIEDIEINARFHHFFNLKINLIFILNPENFINFNQSKGRFQKTEQPIQMLRILEIGLDQALMDLACRSAVCLFVCMSDHNSGNPLTDTQILNNEIR